MVLRRYLFDGAVERGVEVRGAHVVLQGELSAAVLSQIEPKPHQHNTNTSHKPTDKKHQLNTSEL